MNITKLTISKHGNPKDELINEIISHEWDMFQEVKGINGRASCQDDAFTFYIMRYSQHSSYSEETLKSYLNDLIDAIALGQNLIQNKYAYMMEFTDPETYKETIEGNLPLVSEEKMNLINQITTYMDKQNDEMRKAYPVIAKRSRPVSSNTNGTSSSTYSIGELKTFSINTLQNMLEDYLNASAIGENIIINIVSTTMKFYGYESLDVVECNMKSNNCCGGR